MCGVETAESCIKYQMDILPILFSNRKTPVEREERGGDLRSYLSSYSVKFLKTFEILAKFSHICFNMIVMPAVVLA